MDKISLLDCTLRDGGYINNWRFGKDVIRQIYQKLCQSSMEIIECGYLSETRNSDQNTSIFHSISAANALFEKNSKCNAAVMVNCGEFAPEHLEPFRGGAIHFIRIAFHKHQLDEAKKICSVAKKQGYKVFLQPMYTLGYTEKELALLVTFANIGGADAVYIVDSFGTMRNKDLLRIYRFLDGSLDASIEIGFHSHNNLQLSFSNTQELLAFRSQRPLLIDSSVFGMGRGAGNLCSELMVQYFNENMEQRYDLVPILEIIDEFILPIYSRSPWGYSVPYYLAAIHDVHPNYATYLMNRGSLCVKDMNHILDQICAEKKHLYDDELIEQLYKKYQVHSIDDSRSLEILRSNCEEKRILILAPGINVLRYKEKINQFIKRYQPIVFGVNHIPEYFQYDFVFVSSLKRFQSMSHAVEQLGSRLICTSNIAAGLQALSVDYASYLTKDPVISDNSGLLLINLLKRIGIKEFVLAGFDGLSVDNDQDYYDIKLNSSIDTEEKNRLNEALTTYFSELSRTCTLSFITPTIYGM